MNYHNLLLIDYDTTNYYYVHYTVLFYILTSYHFILFLVIIVLTVLRYLSEIRHAKIIKAIDAIPLFSHFEVSLLKSQSKIILWWGLPKQTRVLLNVSCFQKI